MFDNKKPNNKVVVIVTFLLIVAVLVIGYVIKTQRDNAAVLQAGDVETAESTKSSKIVVQVDGAVNKPGVYELSGDIRGIDAVNAAGGLRQDADTAALNLAAKVEDGAKITVPAQGEAANAAAAPAEASGQVNINTASKEELMQLSGIGEVIAQHIIDYRTQNGSFSSIDEIKAVNRIGDKTFEQIKDQITV